MTLLDAPRYRDAYAKLCASHSRRPDDQQRDAWWDVLGPLPIEHVEAGMITAARDEDRYFPKVGKVYGCAAKCLADARVHEARAHRLTPLGEGWVNPETGVYEPLYRCGECEDTGWLPIAAETSTGDGDPRPPHGGRVRRWTEVRDGEPLACVRRCACRRWAS